MRDFFGWFSRDVIAAMLVENKRFLICSFCFFFVRPPAIVHCSIVICVPSTEQAVGSQYTFENASVFAYLLFIFSLSYFFAGATLLQNKLQVCSSLYKSSLYEINYAPLISLKHGRNCNAPKQSRTLLSFLYQGSKGRQGVDFYALMKSRFDVF